MNKGNRGKQGKQGPRGLPCAECACNFRQHTTPTRVIREKGSRTLLEDDSCVIVDTLDECKFYLPEITTVDIESGDHYYYPIKITIIVKRGTHCISTGSKKIINGYYDEYSLDERKAYTLISSVDGKWDVI